MSSNAAVPGLSRRTAPHAAQPGDRVLIAGGTALSFALAATILAVLGTGSAGTELALRMTARLSFVWFILAFIAAPLRRLWASPLSAWLVRRRRALGVTFGLSMAVHVGCILRLFVLYAPQRPPMVTDADFIIGVPGLILVALLTLTSLDALKRRLSPTAWRRLHVTGIWVVWAIFFLCLVDSVGRKETDHPILAYHLFIAVLIGALALRIVAARRRAA
jgi:DMSO/TMAO reductase YedYZ heme-binding membrane subunit